MAGDRIQNVEVAIIGAGWYGLVAARTYLRLKPSANLLILDSDSSVGGVWSRERLYPNLVAQVKLGLFNYSDSVMHPNAGDSNDPRVTGEMIHDYLQTYAEDHDLLRRIRFNTFVEKTRKSSAGWCLTIRDSEDVIETEKLLVCTGVTSIPNMPTFSTSTEHSSIPIIHSRDLGSAYEDIQRPSVKEVVVIGAAKSAYDAVYLLLSMGKKVTWMIRTEGAGPLAILPAKILGLAHSIAIASTRLMTYFSPSILNTKGWLYWTLQRTIPGRWCVGRFWDFLDCLSSRHAGYAAGDHVARLKPEIERQSVFWANSGLGVVTLPDFWQTLHSPRLKVIRDRIVTTKGRLACLQSGSVLEPDYIVACTGWGDHFAFFDAETKALLGLPLYGEAPAGDVRPVDQVDWTHYDAAAEEEVNARLPFLAQSPKLFHMETLQAERQKAWRLYRRAIPIPLARQDDRSMAILGQIHTVQTPLVAEVQSLWAILYLLREIDLPDVNTMAHEVALWNAWTRKRYLNQGQKFPYSLYDFLPYIDALFFDLGLTSRRKSNIISELFSPYRAADFTGFVDEYLSKAGDLHEAKGQKTSKADITQTIESLQERLAQAEAQLKEARAFNPGQAVFDPMSALAAQSSFQPSTMDFTIHRPHSSTFPERIHTPPISYSDTTQVSDLMALVSPNPALFPGPGVPDSVAFFESLPAMVSPTRPGTGTGRAQDDAPMQKSPFPSLRDLRALNANSDEHPQQQNPDGPEEHSPLVQELAAFSSSVLLAQADAAGMASVLAEYLRWAKKLANMNVAMTSILETLESRAREISLLCSADPAASLERLSSTLNNPEDAAKLELEGKRIQNQLIEIADFFHSSYDIQAPLAAQRGCL
ncbi:hypothetical protein EJ04DRAFT_564300 [Polyplosphaeria fusca]|uniref:Flavin-containing monooxygenase n=1 Tax=Polyplosphaeria fusca TaxID=682080 RepID=A0A9P4UZP3_9PLEO|nr:hypothetical protein EJ04DRAFT_564300 [Polyplosphaeria fusca]